MVAISHCKGNLHRVPVPSRRWLMPTPKISLKDFKTLLHRRSIALSRLQSTNHTTSNPYPNANPNLDHCRREQHQPAEYSEDIDNVVSALKVDTRKLVAELADSNEDENDNRGSMDVDDLFLVRSGKLVTLALGFNRKSKSRLRGNIH